MSDIKLIDAKVVVEFTIKSVIDEDTLAEEYAGDIVEAVKDLLEVEGLLNVVSSEYEVLGTQRVGQEESLLYIYEEGVKGAE